MTVVATTGAAVVVTACVFTITCGAVVSFAGAGLAEVVTTGAFTCEVVEAAALRVASFVRFGMAIAGKAGGATVVATAGSLALSTAVSFLTAATGT